MTPTSVKEFAAVKIVLGLKNLTPSDATKAAIDQITEIALAAIHETLVEKLESGLRRSTSGSDLQMTLNAAKKARRDLCDKLIKEAANGSAK